MKRPGSFIQGSRFLFVGIATKCTSEDGCSCIPIGKCRQCSRLDLVCNCSLHYYLCVYIIVASAFISLAPASKVQVTPTCASPSWQKPVCVYMCVGEACLCIHVCGRMPSMACATGCLLCYSNIIAMKNQLEKLTLLLVAGSQHLKSTNIAFITLHASAAGGKVIC